MLAGGSIVYQANKSKKLVLPSGFLHVSQSWEPHGPLWTSEHKEIEKDDGVNHETGVFEVRHTALVCFWIHSQTD